MGSVERKLNLLENIVRLRRAQRRLPGDQDLAAVRSELERELGATVSRRLAARFLGVSHTALGRWIEAGDVPLVYNPRGRHEVPVPALLALRERVDEERRRGTRRRHVLERALLEGRERARELPLDDLARAAEARRGRHDAAARRALAYHRAIAHRLDRRMIDEALHRVWRWRDEGKLDPRYAEAWADVLALPLEEVRKAMTEDSDRGHDLRQNSPFAGMLSEPERRRILEAVR